MAKALAAEMVVADLDHELRLERTPLCRPLGRPAARAARRVAGEAGLCNQRLEAVGQCGLVVALDRGGEADMVQQSLVIVEAEQQRADHLPPVDLVARVAEPAYHAIGAAQFLDLLHAVAIAGLIGQVDALGDHAVTAPARLRQPFLRKGVAWRRSRQAKART